MAKCTVFHLFLCSSDSTKVDLQNIIDPLVFAVMDEPSDIVLVGAVNAGDSNLIAHVLRKWAEKVQITYVAIRYCFKTLRL